MTVVTLDDDAKLKGAIKLTYSPSKISVAEIICKKDNAEILEKTIKDGLAKGLDTLTTNQLHLFCDANNKIDC